MSSISSADLCQTPDISDDENDDLIPTAVPTAAHHSAKKATDVDVWSMNLDAFILNTSVFGKTYFIAPLSRPDHSSFLPGIFSKPDAIPMVDIDGAYPWSKNSRIADVTQKEQVRENRLGVYLHWCLPQAFRTSDASSEESQVKQSHPNCL